MKTTPSLFRVVLLIGISINCLVTAQADSSPSAAASASSGGWTRVNDDDAAITYSAKMLPGAHVDYYGKDMPSGTAVGEWCTFSFIGTGVKWIGGKAGDHGKADVYLDGKLDATIDSTAPSWLMQQEIYQDRPARRSAPVHASHQDPWLPGRRCLRVSGIHAGFNNGERQGPSRGNALLQVPSAQAPYLNPTQHYPLGNGVAMAGFMIPSGSKAAWAGR